MTNVPIRIIHDIMMMLGFVERTVFVSILF